MGDNSYIKMVETLRNHAKVVDLSYTMERNMPFWPTQPKYEAAVRETYEEGGMSFHQGISLSEHTGTHMDAPKHFISGGCPVDKLDPKTVMGRGVVIQAKNITPCGLLPLERIRAFETENGEIRPRDIVMICFGWEDKYAIAPEERGFLKDWPGISKESAQYLADKGVSVVGCDTLSVDAFGAERYAAHEILLGQGILIMENLCNLSKLPSFCAVVGLWNKFKGGSGSPIRLVAFVE